MEPNRRPTRRLSDAPPRGAPRTSTRFAPPVKKSNKGLIIGGCVGGGVLLLIIIIAAASSGGGAKGAKKPASRAKAVSYDEMEREGLRKCDEGLGCVQRSEYVKDTAQLRTELEKGKNLITDGLALLDQVNQKTQRMYDTTRYGQALKVARTKLMEMSK